MRKYLVTYEKPNQPLSRVKVETTNCNTNIEALNLVKAMLPNPNDWVWVVKELKETPNVQ
jgi:hypothetical protein